MVAPEDLPGAPANLDWIRCEMCRHRDGVGFAGLDDREAAFMNGFKRGREAVAAGRHVPEGPPSPLLLTLYSGLALKLRVGGDGSASALGLAFPGDLIGAETLVGVPQLKLRALTDVTYCRFDPERWTELAKIPSLAERVFRAQAIATRELEARLAATRQPASRRLCHFVLCTYESLLVRKLVRGLSFRLPLPRQELAEMLGLTTVHLRRVLASLAEERVVEFVRERIVIGDLARLRSLAGPTQASVEPRPLL